MESSYYSKGRKQVGLFSFLRDILIARFPFSNKLVATYLVPYQPDYIFLTHPRNWQDVLSTFPFLRGLSCFLPQRVLAAMLTMAPCYIVAYATGPSNKKGYVISVVDLPSDLFASRSLTRKRVDGCLDFFKKISSGQTIVGLAAWWPIISSAGQLFVDRLPQRSNIKITNGHTATLASLYLSVIDLATLLGTPLDRTTVLIVGAGKVGGALAELLSNRSKKIGLADKNKVRLASLRAQLLRMNPELIVEGVHIGEQAGEDFLLQQLQNYDITVCTTSNTELLVSSDAKLKNCLILDDSRPEAFPRLFSHDRRVAVLEGGLMNIPGVKLDSDFGFGTDSNIFGCLSEAIILSLDERKILSPSIGELDKDNFFKLIEFCKNSGIQRGDFKSGQTTIADADIQELAKHATDS